MSKSDERLNATAIGRVHLASGAPLEDCREALRRVDGDEVQAAILAPGIAAARWEAEARPSLEREALFEYVELTAKADGGVHGEE